MSTAKRTSPLTNAATLALTATTLATTLTFCRVFPDWSFLGPFVVIGASMHAVMAATRWQRWGIVTTTLLAGVVLAVLLGVLYYNDTLFGFLPTRATWNAGWQELADSFSLFRTTVAPVPSDGGFAVAIALGTGLCAYLSDSFAFRAYGRVEAIVPSGLLFVTASALGTDRHRLVTAALWLACVVVTVALLRAAHGETTTAWLGGGARSRTIAVITGAATLAVIAMIAGTVIGPRLPGAEARALIDTKTRDSSGTQSISPLVDVQARLVNRSNTELFTVTSSVKSYWRLTTLSEFNGQQFGAPEREYIDTDSLDASEIPQTVAVRQQIRIASLGSFWVPAAADPVDVSSTESLLFHTDSSTIIRERGNLFPGLGYTVTSVVPTFSAEQLRAATASNPPGEQYRSLPDDFSQDLRDLAAAATAGAATPYDQAVALQNYFRTNFTYNVNVSRGHSIRSIEAFINAGEGYCEQFSVSYAALARALGLPTRVAVGFTPGDQDAAGVWHVRGKHAHAWPEVWFDGVGWVPFEPTPGRGVPGGEAYTGVQAQQEGGVLTDEADPATGGNGAGGAPPVPSTVQPTVPTIPIEGPGEPTGVASGEDAPAATIGSADRSFPWSAVLLVLAAIGLWALLMPPIARLIVRRSRRRPPAERVVAGWRRATAAVALLGARRRPNETPVEHATRAWKSTGIDEKSLRDLADRATVATYASDHVTAGDADAAVLLASRIGRLVEHRAPFAVRVLARLDPRRAAVLG
ncbi:MAG TPA: transglutaminaseTgpA domain-containing protein [Ilumatobacteraceae bacterium]